ncbi:MAG: hypothetical protein KAI16_00435 [Candidatus Pacebacteria bacterium]|nr:hypothetical protein [Candidatus Paceibacterota bacterium]
MTTISVPLNQELDEFIQDMIDNNNAETKSGVVRMALRKLKEEQLIKEIIEAKNSVKKYGTFSGDLDKLVKKI